MILFVVFLSADNFILKLWKDWNFCDLFICKSKIRVLAHLQTRCCWFSLTFWELLRLVKLNRHYHFVISSLLLFLWESFFFAIFSNIIYIFYGMVVVKKYWDHQALGSIILYRHSALNLKTLYFLFDSQAPGFLLNVWNYTIRCMRVEKSRINLFIRIQMVFFVLWWSNLGQQVNSASSEIGVLENSFRVELAVDSCKIKEVEIPMESHKFYSWVVHAHNTACKGSEVRNDKGMARLSPSDNLVSLWAFYHLVKLSDKFWHLILSIHGWAIVHYQLYYKCLI